MTQYFKLLHNIYQLHTGVTLSIGNLILKSGNNYLKLNEQALQ